MIRRVAADGSIETGGAFTPVVRPRIIDRLQAAARGRIVLIIAPAGYGKTVALRQYLATMATTPSALFALRSDHATLLGFLRGFAEALGEVAPDLRKTVFGAYEKNAASKTPGVDLAMWMHAHIKSFGGVIALDDLQIAENDPEITRFLVLLIERTRGRVRWIISSRSALDLPVGSWLAYGEMELNIDEHDLSFTMDEARLTARAARVSVRDDELAQILEMTSGWPTAMSFALRSSTRSVDLRNISATTREMVYRYLAEQVYASLDEKDRELLHLAAYLPEIELQVLRHAGYSRAKAAVEALRVRVAFIYPERPDVYRAHDMFADFLRHQVEMLGDAAVREVRSRAARALEAAGQHWAALRHYAAISSQEDVLRILRERGVALMEHAHGDAVSEALNALPPGVRMQEPAVLALRALHEQHGGRLDRAQGLFERAMSQSHDVEQRAQIAVRLGALLYDQQKTIADQLEPFVDDANVSVDTRGAVLSILVPSYAIEGRRDDCLTAMVEAENLLVAIDDVQVRARVFHRLGIAALVLGTDVDTMTGYFTRAQALATESNLYVTLAATLGGLFAIAFIHEDDWIKSAWLAQQSLNAALKAGARASVQLALLQLLNIEVLRATPERVRALDKQFSSTITSDVERTAFIVPIRSMLAAWDGRFDEALRMLSTFTERSTYKFDRALNGTLLALYAIAAGERDRAVSAAASALTYVDDNELESLHGARIAEIVRSLCAIVQSLAGRATVAQKILSRKAAQGGAVVEAMRVCAQAVLRYGKTPALRDEVSDAAAGLHAVGAGGLALLVERVFEAATQDAAAADNPLTKAEREVLQELADGLSAKEIGERTGRSVFTVRAHIQNIIKKLGCSGQGEALAVARRKRLVNFE